MSSHKQNKQHQNTKSKNKDNSYTIHSNITPIAPRLRTVLKYADNVSSTTSGAGFSVFDFNLNGLFDPNSTGTGHQPMGFDQLSSLYQRYRVYKVRWQVILASALSSSQALLAVLPSNASGPSTFDTLVENSYAKTTWMTGAYNGQLSGSIDLAKLNGKTHTQYSSDDTTQALVTANPTEVLRLHVGVKDYNGVATYYSYVVMWFECEFSDPVQLGPS